MSKIILQRISSRSVYNLMLCNTRNVRRDQNSVVSQLPTKEENSNLTEYLRNPVTPYPPEKKSVKYPEPVHPILPSEFKEQELLKLKENILFAPDFDTVFNIYVEEKDKFELMHFQNVLNRLVELAEHCTGDESSNLAAYIQGNQIFQSLCYDVWKSVPQMESTMALYTLKHLLKLKVSSNSVIIQSLLQMARHQINEYNFNDLIFLHKLLKDIDNCNLKDALEKALPTVLENSVNFHFPIHLRFHQMSQLLNICITAKISCLNDVINYIYKSSLPKLMKTESDFYIQKQLSSLLINLCELDSPLLTDMPDENVVSDLMFYCLDTLVENYLNEINPITLLNILRKIGNFFEKTGNYCVMHEKFLSDVTERCLGEDWNINMLFKVIEAQMQMNYVQPELVSFVALELNEDVLGDLKDVNIPLILFALASSNLPEERSRNAANFLLKNFKLEFANTNIAWIRLAMCILYFNHFDLSILKGIIDQNFIKRYLKNRSDKTYDYEDIANLNKYMKCFKETSDLNIHSKFLSTEEKRHPAELTNLLTRIVGNEDFILSNIVTPQGNYIDHIVVLEEGKLINLKSMNFSEIFNDKSGMKKIAIMEVPEPLTVQPQYKLNISCKVNFHLIEREGFVILPIFEREISDLRENAPSHIRTKLENFGIYKIQ